jgi:hypothetical protein
MISSYVLDFTKGAVQGVMIIFSFFHPAGKAGGSQIRRCQGIAVKSYGFTLGVLALTASGFCNVRVYTAEIREARAGRFPVLPLTGKGNIRQPDKFSPLPTTFRIA